ncbi:fucose mutarotase-like [Paramacrobiotus metropolitanus]|uniref:fucose mutarotase-like n=1 Tax=Paramacrobiotus metropolitanus TaxID=2943436 RepID=UPI00244577B2|nr:fucose mutarotase-like [Paramacrobiotus metropolitanus]
MPVSGSNSANSGLFGIPANLSPDLLHAMASMEEGDEIVLADSFFPVSSVCTQYGPKAISASTSGIPDLLASILKLFPIRNHPSTLEALQSGRWIRSSPVYMMYSFENDSKPHLSNMIWRQYQTVLDGFGISGESVTKICREDFLGKARTAYAVVTTKDTFYGCLILKKGRLHSARDVPHTHSSAVVSF